MIHVNDNVEAIVALMEANPMKVCGEVFNIGYGRPTSVGKIARMVLEALGVEGHVVTRVEDRPGQVCQHWADTAKIRQTLNWEPKFKLADGIAQTAAWYRDNEEWWRPLQWMRHVSVTLPSGETVIH